MSWLLPLGTKRLEQSRVSLHRGALQGNDVPRAAARPRVVEYRRSVRALGCDGRDDLAGSRVQQGALFARTALPASLAVALQGLA